MLQAFSSPAPARIALILGVAAACWTTASFRKLRPAAAALMLPYTTWLATIAAIVIIGF